MENEKELIKGKFSKIKFIITLIIFAYFDIQELLMCLSSNSENRTVRILTFVVFIVISIIAIACVSLSTFSKSLLITDKRVRGTIRRKTLDLPLDSITSATSKKSIFGTMTIGFSTPSGIVKFSSLSNGEKVFEIANSLINERQGKVSQTTINQINNSDEYDKINKLKALFDEGIITQEEFEAKKKELLGL